MSTALPYLQKLRKSDLTEFAETSNLKNYANFKKSELEAALDEHLRSNSISYGREPSLAEYYRRLDAKVRSPVKKLAEKVSDVVSGPEDTPAPVKRGRRKTKSAEEDASDTDAPTTSAFVKTGSELVKQSQDLVSQIPASPAVVADAIDHQTRRIRNSISRTYARSQIDEYSDYVRELLSSSVTITVAGLLIEAYGLRATILPNKLLTEIPPIRYVTPTLTPVTVPDLFQLLTSTFWAPFFLWILVSIVTPATISYFLNLPLKQLPHHTYATRRASLKRDPRKQFDPFIFNLAKGLASFLILAQHVQLGIFSHYTVALVNQSIPGGYKTVVTSSGLAAAVSLYEAVLKK